jgi:hypothetical protein
MDIRFGWVLTTLAVLGPASIPVRAGDSLPERATGQVLVLDNERTLEGNIERQGDQFRVRRPLGELRIQSDKVLRLCQSQEEAYEFLRSRANLREPGEHIRLAEWCDQHGLHQQALQEVNLAAALRPSDPEVQRLRRALEHVALAPSPAPLPAPGEPASPAPVLPPVTTESLSLFVTRVQPLLMNACAGCHANARGGNLRLARTYDNALANRRTTLQNLAAVLNQVDRTSPQQSPLLTKAVSVHGDMIQPALKGREAPAYKILEKWVSITLEGPEPREPQPAPGSAAGFQAPRVQKSDAGFASVNEGSRSEPARTARPTGFGQERPKEASQPPAEQQPADPFDPIIFNRQMHPTQPESKQP